MRWTSFKSDDDIDVVEVKALFDLDKAALVNKQLQQVFSKIKKIEITIQFDINKDDTFEFGWYGTKYYFLNGRVKELNFSKNNEIMNAIRDIYNNDPNI